MVSICTSMIPFFLSNYRKNNMQFPIDIYVHIIHKQKKHKNFALTHFAIVLWMFGQYIVESTLEQITTNKFQFNICQSFFSIILKQILKNILLTKQLNSMNKHKNKNIIKYIQKKHSREGIQLKLTSLEQFIIFIFKLII